MIELSDKKILIVVAHPDDEILGCGATMQMLIKNYGCTIRCIILGEGITSRAEQRDPAQWEEELKVHRQNIYLSQEQIGYQSVGIYDLPDNRFDSIPLLEIIKIVEKEKDQFNPDIIFTHHGGDLNIDHRRTFDAVMTSIRPMKGEALHTILTFETPSSTEWQAFNYPNPFLPNFFFKVSEENVTSKVKAMNCYTFEKREFPHPRSENALRNLARYRGQSIGSDYAEAFMLIRNII